MTELDPDWCDLRYDQKKPCKDCPFRKDAEFHQGILAKLPKYAEAMPDFFVHSCHKTDPRSDSEQGRNHKGPIQHCAGALVFMRNCGDIKKNQLLWRAALLGKFRFTQVRKSKDVFGSFYEMLRYYVSEAKKRGVLPKDFGGYWV